MAKKPRLNFWQIWNVSFGFLGVQIGFSLQNANVSRILSNLGADLHSLSFFWLAAPLMGLIVQPIVGAASDRTWNRLGRRGPYIFGGALVATIAMWLMPNASALVAIIPPIIFGATMFALMDGSFNITMQPFRALVADMVPEGQRTLGYSIQSFLINAGAIFGSVLPYFLTNILHVRNTAPSGEVPPSVIWSFYIGGSILLLSVLWTVFRTKEYPPEVYCEQNDLDYETWNTDKTEKKSLATRLKAFFELFTKMPKTMAQLAIVQFFSWFALYLMWVYTTPAVAQHIYGTPIGDASSAAYNEAGNWVGILFGAYSLFAALFSIVMTKIASLIGRKATYSLALALGGLGYISMYFLHTPNSLLISMVGIGIAWAAILAMPYSLLSDALPADKMGVYMGIFNFTIAGPQIISGIVGATLVRDIFGNHAIYMMIICGVSMLLGAASVFFVKVKKHEVITIE
ncbi:MFS transporter [Prolixibacter denitrificans]|uniref:Maltose/moltooligosaccharide transporter n=1 Tax=Prolixibacter denitrificans TaxID=1541063 RepID=A0A2P8CHH8_9BACT|nr:MFS transporter [Prolixibacter denitrificans]PSK84433.1 maltose/moltooligosaccharide transporter [Prolixibacter denitrificans]GET20607.1 sugar transporter [Prolixibacter denitrificans]